MSFKTIYLNTLHVLVIEKLRDRYQVMFFYQDYQLWELSLKTFYNKVGDDLMILNKEGINLVRFDEVRSRRAIQQASTGMKMVHSLYSMNYLKVEPDNMLTFENDKSNKTKSVKIMQEHKDARGMMV